jgi:hypothetical protein
MRWGSTYRHLRNGETVVLTKFAFMPTLTEDGEWVWLERIKVTYKFRRACGMEWWERVKDDKIDE